MMRPVSLVAMASKRRTAPPSGTDSPAGYQRVRHDGSCWGATGVTGHFAAASVAALHMSQIASSNPC